MLFAPTLINGAFLIRPQPIEDERGYFARTFCTTEMVEHGLDPGVLQRSVSYNRRRGTLRGMHFQIAPHQENKLVSCLRGSIYDAIIDLRRESPTYRRWYGVNLDAQTFESLFVPKGCAHGFITLADDTVVHYEISEVHHPESARGLRYDDPAFQIDWPISPLVVNGRDLGYPPYSD